MNRAAKRRQQKLAKKAAKKATHGQPPSDIQQSLNIAMQHHQAGDMAKAESLYQQILQTDPNNPNALNLLGVIAHQSGKNDIAVDLISKAIAIKPDYDNAHNNLGVTFHDMGKLDEAIDSFKQAITINPDYTDAHYNLGSVLQKLERLDEAVISLHKALYIKPNYTDAHNNLGNALKDLGRLDEAIASYHKVIAINPDFAEAHNNLGATLKKLGRLDEAITSYHKAIAINPDFAEAHNNLGATLKKLGRLDEACASYHKAIDIKPDYAEAHNNLGNALEEFGQLQDAAARYQKAIAIKPDYADAHYNLGILQLLTGDFQSGWKNYNWHWQTKDFFHHPRNLREPLLDEAELNRKTNLIASSLAGKKILLWMEQGIGDEIMFASILADLARVAKEVVVECEERLLALFRRSFTNIVFVARQDPPAAELIGAKFDFQLPAGNLGHHFRTNNDSFPKQTAFLLPNKTKREMFRADYTNRWPDRRLIGISWRSGNANSGAKRSTSLDQWRLLLANKNCHFINLQYGDVEEDIAAFRAKTGLDIFNDASVDPLSDMDTFAAQIAALDQVISIDNSTVHMAGALGIPTWVMLPFAPDWRWLLERSDSIWYPTIRLFRQEKRDDWQGVIKSVNEALLLQTNSPQC